MESGRSAAEEPKTGVAETTPASMKTILSSETAPRDLYFLMTSLVTPRPIAWVSSMSRDGVLNLAPYSHFNNCSANPPIVHFTPSANKDTLRNVRETGEFVVNIVTHNLRKQMRITSAAWPAEIDEFEKAGLTSAASRFVKPPRVGAARAALECKLREIIPMGEGFMVFGDVLCFHVAENVMVNGRVDYSRLQPVGKLDGKNYSTVGPVERLDLDPEIAREVADYGNVRD